MFRAVYDMKSSLFCSLKLVLCLLFMAAGIYGNTENLSKDGRRYPLEIYQMSNLMRKYVVTPGNRFVEHEPELGQENSLKKRDDIKNKENMNRQSPKFKGFNSRRRCFLGSPYDCSAGFPDPFSEWSSPWGWTPGPLYPEYGPNFHRGWMRHGGPFGYSHCGCGSPWRGPGCCCGCRNQGWCCKSFFNSHILRRTLPI